MTPTERSLHGILADLLEIDRGQISITRPFSEQGVDSLIGLRFSRQVETLTGKAVELEWLFDYPTIAELSSLLDSCTATAETQRG